MFSLLILKNAIFFTLLSLFKVFSI
jgi:hypothetical protein